MVKTILTHRYQCEGCNITFETLDEAQMCEEGHEATHQGGNRARHLRSIGNKDWRIINDYRKKQRWTWNNLFHHLAENIEIRKHLKI